MAILKTLGTGGKLLGGAAAVVVVALGGYVAYERLSGAPDPAEPEAPLAPAADPDDTADGEEMAAPDAVPPATDPADPLAVDAPAPPRFDLVRVDPEGSALVAGQAAPQAEIAVLVDGDEAAVSTAGSDGGFVAMFSLPPSERARVITLAMRRDAQESLESEEQVLIAPAPRREPPVAEDLVVAHAPELPDPLEGARVREEPVDLATDEPATAREPVLAAPDESEEDHVAGDDPPARPDTAIEDGAALHTPAPASDDRVVAPGARTSDDAPAPDDPALGGAPATAESEPEATDTAAPGRPAAVLEGADAPVTPAPVPDGTEVTEAEADLEGLGTLDLRLSQGGAPEGGALEGRATEAPSEPDLATAEAGSPQAQPGADDLPSGDDPAAAPAARAQPGDTTRPAIAGQPAEISTTPSADDDPDRRAGAEAAPEPAATDPASELPAAEDAAGQETAAPTEESAPRTAPDPVELAQEEAPASPRVADAEPAEEEAAPQAQRPAPAPDAADSAPDGPGTAPLAADSDATREQDLAAPADAPAATAARQPPAVLVTGDGGVRVMPTPEAGDAPEVMDNVVIDAISYSPDGAVRLSGRSSGSGDGSVRLYLDNQPLTTVMIGPEGAWETELPDVDTGVYALRADELDPAGAVISRFETPFRRESPEQLARAGEAPAEGARADVLTVQPGYTLWGISRRSYGRGILYVQVFEANRDQIADPDLIYPGQVFSLPEIPQEAVEALP